MVVRPSQGFWETRAFISGEQTPFFKGNKPSVSGNWGTSFKASIFRDIFHVRLKCLIFSLLAGIILYAVFAFVRFAQGPVKKVQ